MNAAAWIAFFKAQDLPARATIRVAELGPQTLVEVSLLRPQARRLHKHADLPLPDPAF